MGQTGPSGEVMTSVRFNYRSIETAPDKATLRNVQDAVAASATSNFSAGTVSH